VCARQSIKQILCGDRGPLKKIIHHHEERNEAVALLSEDNKQARTKKKKHIFLSTDAKKIIVNVYKTLKEDNIIPLDRIFGKKMTYITKKTIQKNNF
jgi:hypothetical protein